MTIEYLNIPRPAGAGHPPPLSSAIRAGDFIFVSGQVPRNEQGAMLTTGIEAQTQQTLKNIIKVLALADCTLDDVVKVTVWLEDANDIAAFNQVYESYFTIRKPARSTTQAKLVVAAKVEIEAIAYKPSDATAR